MMSCLSRCVACLVLALSPAVMAGAVERERVRLDSLERSEADFKLGVAAQRRGHLDAAAEAYAKAVERDPSFVEAMVNLARVRAAEGRFDQADEWLDRASLVRDDYPDIAAARGLVALGRGDAKLAVSELTRARVVEPDDVEVLINLGAALIEAGLWLEAIGHLDRAARLDTTRSAAVLNLALAHDHRGDAARAAFHYRRYLDLVSPGDPEREAVEARLERLAGRVPHAVKAKAPPEEASEGNTPPDINPTRTAGR